MVHTKQVVHTRWEKDPARPQVVLDQHGSESWPPWKIPKVANPTGEEILTKNSPPDSPSDWKRVRCLFAFFAQIPFSESRFRAHPSAERRCLVGLRF